jgi:hypothetical protein
MCVWISGSHRLTQRIGVWIRAIFGEEAEDRVRFKLGAQRRAVTLVGHCSAVTFLLGHLVTLGGVTYAVAA